MARLAEEKLSLPSAKPAVSPYQTAIDEGKAAQLAAAQAKKDAEAALMAATGKTTLAAAQTAAAAKDVSSNPAVIQAKKDLAAATAAASNTSTVSQPVTTSGVTTQSPLVSTYTDPSTGDIVATYADGSTKILSRGTYLSDRAKAEAEAAAQAKAGRQSAYDLLYQQFNQYGLGALVTPLKGLIESGISPSEFTLKLRETEAYKKRFAANQGRIAKGLRALSEAEYIGLEDQYQNVMRQYGLPASYYTKGDMGVQPGFEKFLAGDVSPAELEDRIQTAQNRVVNAAPEVTRALKQFYPDITNGDILAYALDPEQALTTLKRKVTAAEIGGAALQAGLETGLTRAEELQRYGVTGEAARERYQTIAGYLPRATQLSDIYAKQGMGQYTQTTAEQEVFGLPSAAEAATKRKKLSELEQASFSGQAGRAGGALARERAGQF